MKTCTSNNTYITLYKRSSGGFIYQYDLPIPTCIKEQEMFKPVRLCNVCCRFLMKTDFICNDCSDFISDFNGKWEAPNTTWIFIFCEDTHEPWRDEMRNHQPNAARKVLFQIVTTNWNLPLYPTVHVKCIHFVDFEQNGREFNKTWKHAKSMQ